MSYKIITDSCANLTDSQIEEYGVEILSLKYYIDDTAYESYIKGEKIDYSNVYRILREKGKITTSLANRDDCDKAILPVLEAGEDALILAFSSGLSTTYQSAVIAANELMEQYPDRKINVVDTLCASRGQGLFAYYACQKRDAGFSLEDLTAWCEENKLHVCHWVTVDDLMYLKRGGRISKTVAFAGGLLSIKPVAAIKKGEILMLGKARGSRQGNNLLAQEIGKAGGVDFAMPMLLGYTGISDALLRKYIADSAPMWEGRTECLPVRVVGSTVGTHAGPGAVAAAFFAQSP